jgi:hypothetical protein
MTTSAVSMQQRLLFFFSPYLINDNIDAYNVLLSINSIFIYKKSQPKQRLSSHSINSRRIHLYRNGTLLFVFSSNNANVVVNNAIFIYTPMTA